ncbi:MAG: lysine--tRNA ligase [Bdellovibrionaceae bacterium]|nr:lysine--tRNA ligase [Pseudobdellovibrionaceae bacterium]
MNDQVEVRLEKLQKMKTSGDHPFKNGYEPTHLSLDLHNEYDSEKKETLDPKEISVSVAGRVMAIRNFGKAGFIQVKDRLGNIQVYVQKKALGDEVFERCKELDVGDIIFVEGVLFKTKTDELTVDSRTFCILTKSLRPLPEKFHGITDVETRYRQRYLDLIMNDESKAVFKKRSQIVRLIRQYFDDRGFMEVETPMLHSIVGGAAARPFLTHHNTLDMDLNLRIAPELNLKRLVVGGFDRVYEINRNFRNEGISIQHNPEFTMLEFYQAYATYKDLMDLTEDLFRSLANEVCGDSSITYQGTSIDFGPTWERISVENSVLKYSDFKDKSKVRDPKALREYLEEKGYECKKIHGPGQMLMTIFDEEVEHQLIQPTFVTQYPVEVSPLSRRNDEDSFVSDRFELFIYGREVANAFSELNDPIDQKERFEKQVEAKAAGDEEACDMDDDYIRALEHGLPPTAGEGIGIDRLVMLLTDSPSIRDVILFPQMRRKAD